jgi:hypothetical protein
VSYILALPKTPKGLVWTPVSAWGSLRYAANLAMYTLQVSSVKETVSQHPSQPGAASDMPAILPCTPCRWALLKRQCHNTMYTLQVSIVKETVSHTTKAKA